MCNNCELKNRDSDREKRWIVGLCFWLENKAKTWYLTQQNFAPNIPTTLGSNEEEKKGSRSLQQKRQQQGLSGGSLVSSSKVKGACNPSSETSVNQQQREKGLQHLDWSLCHQRPSSTPRVRQQRLGSNQISDVVSFHGKIQTLQLLLIVIRCPNQVV